MEAGKEGNLGWAAIGGFVLAFDVFAPETLSESVDRAIERHKWLTRLAIGVVALHLMNLLPDKADPLHQACNLTRRLL